MAVAKGGISVGELTVLGWLFGTLGVLGCAVLGYAIVAVGSSEAVVFTAGPTLTSCVVAGIAVRTRRSIAADDLRAAMAIANAREETIGDGDRSGRRR